MNQNIALPVIVAEVEKMQRLLDRLCDIAAHPDVQKFLSLDLRAEIVEWRRHHSESVVEALRRHV